MAKLDFNFLIHLVKCLEDKVEKERVDKTIEQLKKLIKKEKDEIKCKEENGKTKPIG